jgi:threonine/homoserine/homoserine lactone efflux protein
MFDIANYFSFIGAIVIFQVIPGPGTIAILNATARGGVGTGMGAVIGTLIGDSVYMLAAVLGLAAILNAYPAILSAAQWFGIAYLCWMGWKLLRAPISDQPAADATIHGGWRYLRQAFAVSLTNPKVIMFFMAFFPLFLRPGASPITLAVMMVHITVISFIYQAGLVLVGNMAAKWLKRWKSARLITTRLAGIALIAFGAKLALNNR